MADGLTIKQEAFAQAYVENGGNASAAYRAAYDASEMADKTVWEASSRLLSECKVAARVKELRAAIEEAHRLTVADLIKELEEARIAALTAETVQSSAATAATMGKAKLLGYDKQQVEVTGKDGGPIQSTLDVSGLPSDVLSAILKAKDASDRS